MDPKQLAQALARATRLAPASPGTNDSVHLDASNGRLTLRCSNGHVYAWESVPFDGALSASVPRKDLAAALGSVRGEATIALDGATLRISDKKTRAAIQTADEPLAAPTLGETQPLPGGVAEAIGLVAYAASSDPNRPNISGVCWSDFGVAATDGHRLSLVPVGGASAPVTIGNPSHVAAYLARAGAVRYALDGRYARFEGSDSGMVCAVVDGTFPNILGVIPDDSEAMVCDAAALRDAIERALKMADSKSHSVRFDFGQESVTVSSKTDNGSFETTVDASFEWRQKGPVGYNGRYLLDALSAHEGEVRVMVIDALLPTKFISASTPRVDIVMPVRL
jgi:DNA polymerase III sliding clamp (beta) subunit (PCNA family)